MNAPHPTPSSKLLPFEVAIFQAIGRALPERLSDLLALQLAAVNKVQRLLEWNEIELYCMRWFKVRWPEQILFPRKDEHSLAQVQCAFGSVEVPTTVWAVGGHVFSIESPIGLKGFVRAAPKIEVRGVQVAAA